VVKKERVLRVCGGGFWEKKERKKGRKKGGKQRAKNGRKWEEKKGVKWGYGKRKNGRARGCGPGVPLIPYKKILGFRELIITSSE
jgi:hypothetical protein